MFWDVISLAFCSVVKLLTFRFQKLCWHLCLLPVTGICAWAWVRFHNADRLRVLPWMFRISGFTPALSAPHGNPVSLKDRFICSFQDEPPRLETKQVVEEKIKAAPLCNMWLWPRRQDIWSPDIICTHHSLYLISQFYLCWYELLLYQTMKRDNTRKGIVQGQPQQCLVY